MKVLFKSNERKDPDYQTSKKIISKLIDDSFEVYVDNQSYFLNNVKLLKEEDIPSIDFALILGGDGTILSFARKYKDYNLPLLGINLGRVGALSKLELSNYEKYLDLLKNKKYQIENRLTLEGKVFSDNKLIHSFISFNDIIISNEKQNKLISLDVLVNDKLYNQFFADGVAIATPSGSSAYSLSSGGPLLLPTTKCYVLTPICPQFTAFTSVVFEDKDSILISSNSEKAIITVDGIENFTISKNDKVIISKANRNLNMIAFDEPRKLYESIYKVAMSIYKE